MKLAPFAVAGGAVLLIAAVTTGSLAGYVGGSTSAADSAIPGDLLPVYQQAAATCPGLPWSVLAAVGWIESRHAGGHADPKTGQVSPPIVGPDLDGQDGRAVITDPASPDRYAHALGPMQFLPTMWSQWATTAPGRPAGAVPDPQNTWDAIYTAARMLCGDAGRAGDVRAALVSYNHSADYVDAVLAQADLYAKKEASQDSLDSGPIYTGDSRAVVAFALTQIGVPYQWGGTTAGVELDCSGLVVVSYRAVGISLPRTTFEQAQVGVTAPLTDLQPGDLLFFRGGVPTHDLGHVTIYAGDGEMVNAPHTGSTVTAEPVPYAAVQLVRRVVVSAG